MKLLGHGLGFSRKGRGRKRFELLAAASTAGFAVAAWAEADKIPLLLENLPSLADWLAIPVRRLGGRKTEAKSRSAMR
jgi:hypothetical protein